MLWSLTTLPDHSFHFSWLKLFLTFIGIPNDSGTKVTPHVSFLKFLWRNFVLNLTQTFQCFILEVSLIRWNVASRPGFLEKRNWLRDTLINKYTLFLDIFFILQFKWFIYLATSLGASEHLVKKTLDLTNRFVFLRRSQPILGAGSC